MDKRRDLQFVLLILLIDEVSLQSIRIDSDLYQSFVILPCSTRGYESDVFWRYNTSKTVYDIIKGEEDSYDQDVVYKGRVEAFPSEFREGNYSIRLRNVTHTDAGFYSCQIPYTNTVYVELRVRGSDRNRGLTTSTDWIALLHLICILLYGFAL